MEKNAPSIHFFFYFFFIFLCDIFNQLYGHKWYVCVYLRVFYLRMPHLITLSMSIKVYFRGLICSSCLSIQYRTFIHFFFFSFTPSAVPPRSPWTKSFDLRLWLQIMLSEWKGLLSFTATYHQSNDYISSACCSATYPSSNLFWVA